jgi:hypothetical protein
MGEERQKEKKSRAPEKSRVASSERFQRLQQAGGNSAESHMVRGIYQSKGSPSPNTHTFAGSLNLCFIWLVFGFVAYSFFSSVALHPLI